MRVLIRTVVPALLIMAVSCGDNDPFNPGRNDDSSFFPLAVGNTWNYVRIGVYNVDSLSYTVTGVSTVRILGTAEHSEGFQVFLEETMVSDTLQGFTVINTADTSYIRVTGEGFFGYPSLASTDFGWTVPFPMVPGMVWMFRTEPQTTGELLSLSATATVPAGTFDNCAEIRTTWLEGGNMVNTTDYAPNVGMVRNVCTQGVGQFTSDITSRLTGYEPAP